MQVLTSPCSLEKLWWAKVSAPCSCCTRAARRRIVVWHLLLCCLRILLGNVNLLSLEHHQSSQASGVQQGVICLYCMSEKKPSAKLTSSEPRLPSELGPYIWVHLSVIHLQNNPINCSMITVQYFVIITQMQTRTEFVSQTEHWSSPMKILNNCPEDSEFATVYNWYK